MTAGSGGSAAPRRFPALAQNVPPGSDAKRFGRAVPTSGRHADSGEVNPLSPSPAFEIIEPLLDQDALATWLDVSVSSVKKWTQSGPESGRIPRFYRVNGQVRFRQVDVLAWLEGKAVG